MKETFRSSYWVLWVFLMALIPKVFRFIPYWKGSCICVKRICSIETYHVFSVNASCQGSRAIGFGLISKRENDSPDSVTSFISVSLGVAYRFFEPKKPEKSIVSPEWNLFQIWPSKVKASLYEVFSLLVKNVPWGNHPKKYASRRRIAMSATLHHIHTLY